MGSLFPSILHKDNNKFDKNKKEDEINQPPLNNLTT
jgi:hypothetical protein